MRTLVSSLAVTAAAVAFSPAAAAQGTVQVGDAPEYQLGAKTFNSMGAAAAADFRGKPVLVEFWGTR
ncbi:MAG: hypothetical protein ACPG31_14115 [Planctomycetota bacterium]